MTKNGKTFNYTLDEGNFSQLGDTCIGLICYDPSASPIYEEGSICREVTISGSSEIGAGSGLSLVGSLIVIILVGVFFFILSFRLNSPIGKFSFIVISSIIFLIAVFYSMVMVQQNLGGFSSLVSGYSTFFTVLKIIAALSFMALMILALLVAIRFYKFKRGMLD